MRVGYKCSRRYDVAVVADHESLVTAEASGAVAVTAAITTKIAGRLGCYIGRGLEATRRAAGATWLMIMKRPVAAGLVRAGWHWRKLAKTKMWSDRGIMVSLTLSC